MTIATFGLVASSLLLLPQSSFALNANDLYEQGGGGDITPPEEPTHVTLDSTDAGLIITWDDPTDSDFYQMLIYRDTVPLPSENQVMQAYGFAFKGEEKFIDGGAVQGETYTYILRPRDLKNNINMNSTAYSTIYYNPTITTGGYEVVTPPTEKAANVTLVSTSQGVIIEWTDPTMTDLLQIIILRDHVPNASDIRANIYGFADKGVQRFVDSGAIPGATHTYYLVAKDRSNLYHLNTDAYTITHNSSGVIITQQTTATTSPTQTTPTQQTETSSTPTTISPTPTTPEGTSELIDIVIVTVSKNHVVSFSVEKRKRSIEAERRVLATVINMIRRLPSGYDWKYVHYLAYEGEKKDLQRFLDIYKKMPTTDAEWEDVRRMAYGEPPINKVEPLEQTFLKYVITYLNSTPQSFAEWRFLHIITYDLLPKNRNLSAEQNSLQKVLGEKIIDGGENLFWRLVHAFAYSEIPE